MDAHSTEYQQVPGIDKNGKNLWEDIRLCSYEWLFMCVSILMRRTLTISYCSEPVRSSVVERLSVCLANRPKSTDIYGGT